MIIKGKVWIFGDNISTDLIFPHSALRLSPEEQIKMVFCDNRPGWHALVTDGDIIVAGKNFGTGSARPGAVILKRLGLGGLLADSINGTFYRNCVGYGFPAMQCGNVSDIFKEGDIAEFDLRTGRVINHFNGAEAKGTNTPESVVETIQAGGIENLLIRKGLLEVY